MSIANRVNKKKKQQVEETKEVVQNFNLTKDELEFLIKMIGNSSFKGNDLMFIYDLVKKLQDMYVNTK
tara:strand:- start:651 stop:854 length:204 start_codon:yes stop_codon:yes gene_type:complete